MKEYCIIDTNIWEFAYVEPKDDEYKEIHQRAFNLLQNIFLDENVEILLSSYQIAEILDVFRKVNVPKDVREELIKSFESDEFIVKDIHISMVIEACRDSLRSGIHVYDYLVVYPWKGLVTKIYSADSHFQHKDFFTIAEVLNPIGDWTLVEGRKPVKTVT